MKKVWLVVYNNGWEEKIVGFCATRQIADGLLERMPPPDWSGAGMPGMETPRYYIKSEILLEDLDGIPDRSEPGAMATVRWLWGG